MQAGEMVMKQSWTFPARAGDVQQVQQQQTLGDLLPRCESQPPLSHSPVQSPLKPEAAYGCAHLCGPGSGLDQSRPWR